jgi:hypothetical protein
VLLFAVIAFPNKKPVKLVIRKAGEGWLISILRKKHTHRLRIAPLKTLEEGQCERSIWTSGV